MKTVLLIFSLILSNMAAADTVDLGTKADINANWSYTELMTKSEGLSVVQIKLFKRYLWIGNTPVQVAETNFTYLKNPTDDTSKVGLKKLSETIQKSFPKNTLSVKTISNGYELYGKWSQTNRYIKMDLIKKDKDLLIITTFARAGLTKQLMPELNELHSLLSTYNYEAKSSDEKTTFLDFFLPSKSYAQVMPKTNGFPSFMKSSNVSTPSFGNKPKTLGFPSGGLNTTLEASPELNKLLGETNSNIEGLNNNVGKINTTLGDLNKTLGGINDNWGKTNTNLENMAAIVDKQGTAANTNWAESNKIAAQMMDPGHMAKVAYYTAAGAALGAISMNIVMDGLKAGISFLAELFTGDKKKKLEWQDFQQAIQAWDTQLGDLSKLESIVDEMIAAFDFFSDKNLSNDYLKNLNLAMRDMRFDREMMLEKFKNTNLSTGCRQVYFNAADELDQKVKEYDKIVQYASKNSISIDKTSSYFCNQLKELQRKILGAETQMQDLRLAILKAENQFYAKTSDAKDKREDNIEAVNDRINKTLRKRRKFNRNITKEQIAQYERERETWVSECIDAKNSEGKKIKAEIDNSLTHFFEANFKCGDLFDANHGMVARDEKSEEIFKEENNLRKDLVIENNSEINVRLSEEQLSWLTRVHVDAFCYQFAHVEDSKVPAKCKDFPEMLYSLKLSKGYDKARDAYKNKCEDRYLDGIKKLAASTK